MDTNKRTSQNIKCCPIEITLTLLGKKWSINILRDLFFGKTRFSHFLKSNPQLSTKTLSLRLKDLEDNDIIEKNIITKTPVLIEYKLTQKGKALNKILYEMALYSMEQSPNEVFHIVPKSTAEYVPEVKRLFDLN